MPHEWFQSCTNPRLNAIWCGYCSFWLSCYI
jgi:hypothetical protein